MKTKEQKREEAEDRANAYQHRSTKDQLALIEQRPGNSAAERERLARKEQDTMLTIEKMG